MGNQCCSESRKDQQLIWHLKNLSGDEELIKNQKHQLVIQQQQLRRKQRRVDRVRTFTHGALPAVQQGPPSEIFSATQRILTVGDGDLSFSLALCHQFSNPSDSKVPSRHLTNSSDGLHDLIGVAKGPRWPPKSSIDLVASVFDTRQELYEKYEQGSVAETVHKLSERGAQVYYGVDATQLDTPVVQNLIDKRGLKFDRIVFNFPHAGLASDAQATKRQQNGDGRILKLGSMNERHIQLMEDFLHASKDLLRDEDESMVVITQNTCLPFKSWDVVGVAKRAGYKLVSNVPFSLKQYPGYQNRRGFGPNAAEQFNCSSARTFAFALDLDSLSRMDLSKDLQSMKEELASSSPLYLRLPTAASPRHTGTLAFRNSVFHPDCADDEVGGVEQRSVSVIEMDDDFPAGSPKRQSVEAQELDLGQDTQRQTVLPSDRTIPWRQNERDDQKFKKQLKRGAVCQQDPQNLNQAARETKESSRRAMAVPGLKIHKRNLSELERLFEETAKKAQTPGQKPAKASDGQFISRTFDNIHHRAFTDDNIKESAGCDPRELHFAAPDLDGNSLGISTKSRQPSSKGWTTRRTFNGFKKIKAINYLYSFGEVIGEGSFGLVRLAVNKQNQEQYAVKIMKKAGAHGQPRKYLLQNEIDILSDVCHPNILQIHELLQDDLHYLIVSEYIEGGQLFEYMQSKHLQRQKLRRPGLDSGDASFESNSSSYLGKIRETEVRVIAHQLFSALSYLHKKNVVHRDVKPENILLRNAGEKKVQIKLIDFGFAAYCESQINGSERSKQSEQNQSKQFEGGPQKSTKLTEILGSPLYMAPEIVKKQSYDHKVDVWSAGVVIYAMLSGRLPFFGNRKDQVYSSICNDDVPMDSASWQNKSPEVKDFIRLALAKDPTRRPSSMELARHPWFKKGSPTKAKAPKGQEPQD